MKGTYWTLGVPGVFRLPVILCKDNYYYIKVISKDERKEKRE